VIRFVLNIPTIYPEEGTIGVVEEGELPEFGQVWVWDMVYAQMMHALAGRPAGDDLKETLDLWAVNMSSKIYQPFDHIKLKGHLRLRGGLAIGKPPVETESFVVEVSGGAEEMPSVALEITEALTDEQRAAAVLALAQYFIDRNELFAKELPIHILALRKYYADVRLPEEAQSVDEAPLYAIQKALEYFNSVANGTMQ
jgi:hypothetical protein